MTDAFERLNCGQQKFLLGRWLGMVAFGDKPPVAIDLGEQESATAKETEEGLLQELRDARSALETATVAALGNKVQPVDEFLDGLATGIAAISSWVSGSHPYLQELETRVAAFRAKPLDPFGDVLETAREVAVGFYEREGFGLDLPAARCELSLARKQRQPPPGPAVDGELEVKAADRVVARLKLTAAQLWRGEICALTYATLHELVVHGLAAPHARESVDAFAEGWMDVVALQLHDELGRNNLPQRSPLAADFTSGERRSQASIAHDRRADGNELVATGRNAAMTAEDALLASGLDATDARKALWAFSAALNRSDPNSSRRSEFCEAIERDKAGTGALPGFVAAARDAAGATDAASKLEIVTSFVESPACDA